MNQKTLCACLGGYDGLTVFAEDLLPRLQADFQPDRFWQNRSDNGIPREKRLSCASQAWGCW
ncbi:hypothetical protein RP726_07065 [Candidatus Methylospira mobilis]|uniref:hypothetical protein n=1 Tax=Candidatus Methylospira mobilis TaxID=1808979 RepID=UPI0028E68F56|nr:hypothetical protein [Candidatus Methylospira mobilis]WNV06164.1 hypothetical protein RP726_07065 [Candidatus Methylospira mobilis]